MPKSFKNARLATKNESQMRPDPTRIELDSVLTIAFLWSQIYHMTTRHGFNGGTHEDQLKILMQDEYTKRGAYEFTTDELLNLWNSRISHSF